MSQTKQNILVVAILFLSLLSSVALSYIITPNQATLTEQQPIKQVIKEKTKSAQPLKQAMVILLPKVAG
ncbi:hypothetical protein OS175_03715 [Marinicella sp. S1101]|uniref:hypothetical protein n=1 Tax=Marinicella marina TaxID=2996016 RepID=UPI002260D86C|nr:hypothetical protein [Marinicella marina]MCX7552975.1 hypothetical protein [Marinicella marina]MDJ1139715.1 hypothetical protein [Marinicella marina]